MALRRLRRVSKEEHPFGSTIARGTGDLFQRVWEMKGKSSKRQFLPTYFDSAAHKAVCREPGKLIKVIFSFLSF